ncbi:uncharacterized protein RJT20DRAFT_135018 [Scheffersomyces xylosifermentans]|uniref:uncharacterized protein n=1 Tax=Scheffersomyces xylosifermentans TaxID=1304137 RepID=UPI00315CB4E9
MDTPQLSLNSLYPLNLLSDQYVLYDDFCNQIELYLDLTVYVFVWHVTPGEVQIYTHGHSMARRHLSMMTYPVELFPPSDPQTFSDIVNYTCSISFGGILARYSSINGERRLYFIDGSMYSRDINGKKEVFFPIFFVFSQLHHLIQISSITLKREEDNSNNIILEIIHMDNYALVSEILHLATGHPVATRDGQGKTLCSNYGILGLSATSFKILKLYLDRHSHPLEFWKRASQPLGSAHDPDSILENNIPEIQTLEPSINMESIVMELRASREAKIHESILEPLAPEDEFIQNLLSEDYDFLFQEQDYQEYQYEKFEETQDEITSWNNRFPDNENSQLIPSLETTDDFSEIFNALYPEIDPDLHNPELEFDFY